MEFLKKTATYLLEQHKDDFSNLCIVLPNRRAGLFLKKYISQLISKPVFLPHITSIQDFIVELSGKDLVNEFIALTELYTSYAEIKKNEAETFDEFLKWGAKLLQDFDEIDQHLGDAHYIFTYLKEEKNLALWALDKKPLSEFQENYLRFYTLFYDIYRNFSQRLAENKLATYGMCCRAVAECMQKNDCRIRHKKVIFSGLNALTRSEEFIIHSIKDKGHAEMLWDADKYYIDNTGQEAGYFLRKHFKAFQEPEKKWVENLLLQDNKSITITGVAGHVGQVKYAADEINNLIKAGVRPEDIAVILNDENLLIPMLNSIPAEVDKFNITMGFPLKLSPVYSLIDLLFTLQKNAQKFKKVKNAHEPLFYFKDLQLLFSHSYFPVLTGELANGPGHNASFNKLLTEAKKIFYTTAELKALLQNNGIVLPKSLSRLLLPWKQEPSLALQNLTEMILFIKNKLPKKKNIETELLFFTYTIFNTIRTTVDKAKINFSLNTLHQLFIQYVSRATVPFSGEPLSGLQIMGMLETRTLDFENIFLLSVNEGVLPKGKPTNSFIPHSIRLDTGLPTYKHNEQIFAYHFYRLLQRSKNIHIVYNTQDDDFGGGEKSRFASQLLYELSYRNKNTVIKEKLLTIPPGKIISEPIYITKDEAINAKIGELAASGFSHSSLNILRKCGLRYYLHYIAGISEEEEIEETIDSAELGNKIHAILHEMFQPLLQKEIYEKDIEKCFEEVDSHLAKEFSPGSSHNFDLLSGKNLLIFHVVKDYITELLKKQISIVNSAREKYGSYQVLFTEKKLEAELTMQLNNKEQHVKIKGFLDRIDKIDNDIEVIDYKSGNTKNKNFNLDKLLADVQEPNSDYCFQMMLYLILCRNFQDFQGKNISCGVWGLRQIDAGLSKVYIKPEGQKEKIYDLSEEQIKMFEDLLENLLKRLFDSTENFTQTSNEENCKYCPYIKICGKLKQE
ncbi:MAG: PD-(D/E)XK nuclease family protein [Bacteroidales bacterium]|jgi:RecB family exonuclease|nr:PD-(D/E)XK nuclease family protein [Bacteroidales bacterium]MDD4213919.1 PD-(D/E)XK nuclease family protein [Bacteroidales bacterium]